MYNLLSTLRFIINHPLNKTNKIGALLRFVKWQINCRLNPYPIVYPFTERSKLLIWRGLTGATGNLYCGLHEFNDMAFLLHFLRPGDLFVDIGANIGSYTMLAAGHVGTNTIAIEPVPETFNYLQNNIQVNNISGIAQAMNIGLGAEKGIIKFTKSLDTVNHVATPDEQDTINVPIDALDNVLNNQVPILLKVDVEGFETEVLRGSVKTLSNPNLKGIIIELNGSGLRYGYDDNEIHKSLLGFGFQSYDYDPINRKIIAIKSFGSPNTIYLRDIEYISNRVLAAEKVNINNISF